MRKLSAVLGYASLVAALWLSPRAVAGPVPEVFSRTNSLPPTNGVYISPAMWHALYAQGIIIRDVRHRFFTANLPVPPLGATQTHKFGSTVDYSISTDNGLTFQPASGTADCTVRVTHTRDSAGTSTFQTEMLSLSLSSGTTRLRESPTLPSRGQTTVRSVPGGYMIASFFDVFTELSVDGGQTWLAAAQAAHVELRNDPAQVQPVPAPTPLLPPPNGVYISPQLFHALYAQGIVIKDVRHKFFNTHLPPPPVGGSTTHTFNSELDMKLSTDSGVTFQQVRTPAQCTVRISNASTSGTGFFDTEMLQLDISGGTLPVNIRLRESPTLASRGATQLALQPDGSYMINSFFDIFTELSTDNGQNWSPSTSGAVRMELTTPAPPQRSASSALPPLNGDYISPQQWHALYAQGIIVSNVTHRGFTQNQPLPQPGQSVQHTFDSQVDLDLVIPPGGVNHVTAPALVTVRITSLQDSGTTRFFETEMLALDIQGGGLPAGVMVRESPSKPSLGRTSVQTIPGGLFKIDSFFDIFTELSTDSGQNWLPSLSEPATMRLRTPPPAPLLVTCPVNILVAATGPGGAVVSFTPSASGGCDAAPTVTATPPSGSLFPVGVTTVTCVAKDSCGNSATCTFTVTVTAPATVQEYFFTQPGLPPLTGVYISPAQFHVLSSLGIIIRDVRHRFFTQNVTPPPLGGTSVHTFDSRVDFDLSTDNGLNFQPVSASAAVTVRLTHTHDTAGTSMFQTEMLALDIAGGTLPSNIRLRESPTLASLGQTSVRLVPGGYMISSFFDVNTELSNDGGATWVPSPAPAHVELRGDPARVPGVPQPTRLVPPPNSEYISPAQWHLLYAQGIVIRDVKHKYFTAGILPPASGSQSHTFNSALDMQLSIDGGQTFQTLRLPAVSCSVSLTAVGSIGSGRYDTEMLSMNAITGLPAGMRLRESPTERSRGATQITLQSDGTYQINSFFDIFVELSRDNGGTWSPATSGPVHVEMTQDAAEQITTPSATPLPPLLGEYTNAVPRPLIFVPFGTTVVIISNVSHKQFSPIQVFPLPVTGSVTDVFGSTVEMDVAVPGQLPQHMFASGTVSTKVSSTTGKDNNGTRYFDTEMLSMNLSSGGLLIRESPTLQSLGRTSWRSSLPSERISSFFDVFAELSLDSGVSWWPATNGPHTVRLRYPFGLPPISIICPPDIIVYATSPAGAVVTYATPTAGGGCNPPPTVTSSPASGSTFPVGTTTVTCVATDSCGNKTICTFTVTVKPYVRKRFFPTNQLPPPNSQYISPAQWHALYAGGIVITNASHRRFLGGQPPPPQGVTNIHGFGSEVTLLLSTDGGVTFQPVTGNADVTVSVGSPPGPPSTEKVYSTEMLSLNLSGGTLPPGVMIRESPTKASTGETKMTSVPGGFMIDSFFDVFTELSLNGPGGPWIPTEQPAHMELGTDPGAQPTSLTSPRFVGGQPRFSLLTRSGLRYFTRYKDNLGDPDWFILHAATGNDTETTVSDFLQNGVLQRYYQVLVEEDGDPLAP